MAKIFEPQVFHDAHIQILQRRAEKRAEQAREAQSREEQILYNLRLNLCLTGNGYSIRLGEFPDFSEPLKGVRTLARNMHEPITVGMPIFLSLRRPPHYFDARMKGNETDDNIRAILAEYRDATPHMAYDFLHYTPEGQRWKLVLANNPAALRKYERAVNL